MLTGFSCGRRVGIWVVSMVVVPVATDWEVACDALECDEIRAMLLWIELRSRLETEVGVTGLVGWLVEEGSVLPSFVRFFLRKPRLGRGIKSYFRVDSRARPGPSNWEAGDGSRNRQAEERIGQEWCRRRRAVATAG